MDTHEEYLMMFEMSEISIKAVLGQRTSLCGICAVNDLRRMRVCNESQGRYLGLDPVAMCYSVDTRTVKHERKERVERITAT